LPDRNPIHPTDFGVRREAQRHAALVKANRAAGQMNRRGAETESGFGDVLYDDEKSPVGATPRTVSKDLMASRWALGESGAVKKGRLVRCTWVSPRERRAEPQGCGKLGRPKQTNKPRL
jgi:hypothetical protein